MLRRFPGVLLICCVLLLPALGFCWGNDGHRIICEVAFQNLSGEAKDFVSQLRQADPEHRASFSDDCVWADDARNTSEFGFTRTFHYINIPEEADGVDLARDCNTADHCVTWAIPHYAAILADASQSDLERARALKFLGHFVGDLHQPLHAGFPGDRGGNTIHVTYFGAHRLLHAVWDTSILSVAELRYPDGAHTLADPIDQTDIAAWSNFDVLGWTNESYHFAKTHAYRLPSGDKVEDQAELDLAYHYRSLEIVKKQLQRAGIRLAFLIERAIANQLDFP